jgi:hypothetical protein
MVGPKTGSQAKTTPLGTAPTRSGRAVTGARLARAVTRTSHLVGAVEHEEIIEPSSGCDSEQAAPEEGSLTYRLSGTSTTCLAPSASPCSSPSRTGTEGRSRNRRC